MHFSVHYADTNQKRKQRREERNAIPIVGITFTSVIAVIYLFYSVIQIIYLFIGQDGGIPAEIT